MRGGRERVYEEWWYSEMKFLTKVYMGEKDGKCWANHKWENSEKLTGKQKLSSWLLGCDISWNWSIKVITQILIAEWQIQYSAEFGCNGQSSSIHFLTFYQEQAFIVSFTLFYVYRSKTNHIVQVLKP